SVSAVHLICSLMDFQGVILNIRDFDLCTVKKIQYFSDICTQLLFFSSFFLCDFAPLREI
ncbi:MAG: hypothetical protein ACK44G_03015, partial [Aphanizomenon sp.]